MITILKIIFLLGFIIIIHELGHYAVAKICKVDVNEFSVGFGPKLLSKKIKGTVYQLRLIPLGGFVNLEGEEEHSEKERSFNKASIPKRISIILAGALVNVLFGIFIYFVLTGIRYLNINNDFYGAVQYAGNSTIQLIQTLGISLKELLMGKLKLNDMTGPVGISSMVSQTGNISEFMYLLSLISISLGITNLLPIIPLDGGKAVLLIIEAIRRKPLKQETELKIQSLGFTLLILISIIVTCNDIAKLM